MFKCLNCNKETKNPKFCSKSCSASFNNKITKVKNKKCKFCDDIIINKAGIYCNVECYNKHKFNKTIDRFYKGLLTSTNTIRKVLIHLKGNICSECNLPNEWNNKSLTLHIDHIDGNSDNNESSNLRLLCPNCHSQTETYGWTGEKKNTKRNIYLRKYKTGI